MPGDRLRGEVASRCTGLTYTVAAGEPAGGPRGPFLPLSPRAWGLVPVLWTSSLSLWLTFLIKARD